MVLGLLNPGCKPDPCRACPTCTITYTGCFLYWECETGTAVRVYHNGVLISTNRTGRISNPSPGMYVLEQLMSIWQEVDRVFVSQVDYDNCRRTLQQGCCDRLTGNGNRARARTGSINGLNNLLSWANGTYIRTDNNAPIQNPCRSLIVKSYRPFQPTPFCQTLNESDDELLIVHQETKPNWLFTVYAVGVVIEHIPFHTILGYGRDETYINGYASVSAIVHMWNTVNNCWEIPFFAAPFYATGYTLALGDTIFRCEASSQYSQTRPSTPVILPKERLVGGFPINDMVWATPSTVTITAQ